MHIATATDSDFVELAAVLLASLRVNGGDAIESVNVFCDRLNDSDKVALQASYAPKSLSLIDLDENTIKALGQLATNRLVSAASYARLLVPDLLPYSTGRILYIDCDALVNHDLSSLATTDLDNHLLAAYSSAGTKRADWFESFGSPRSARYFNAGVLLIDIEQWRAAAFGQHCIELLALHPERMRLMDQDVLNAALGGRFLPLERTWNFYESTTGGRFRESTEAYSSAQIIHFVGKIKPNFSNSRHPVQSLYMRYRDETPFRNRPLVGPATRTWRSIRMKARRIASRPLRSRATAAISQRHLEPIRYTKSRRTTAEIRPIKAPQKSGPLGDDT